MPEEEIKIPKNKAAKKETKLKSVFYRPTLKATKSPRRFPYRNTDGTFTLITIGGEIVTPANPPKRAEVRIPAASQGQLKALYATGRYNKLIEKVEA